MLRKPNCQYRVVIRDGRWHVSEFDGRVMNGPQRDFSETSVPDWLVKEVALLRLVDPMGEIDTIGHRIGEAFWLNPKKENHHED